MVKYFSNQISIHHEGQNILCDLCNKTFSASEYLEIHIRKFHTVQESTSNLVTTPIHSKVPKDDEEDSSTNNECDSCGKSFDTSNYLNRHIYQVHILGKKNYTCDFCGKSFSKQAPNLKKHIRIEITNVPALNVTNATIVVNHLVHLII